MRQPHHNDTPERAVLNRGNRRRNFHHGVAACLICAAPVIEAQPPSIPPAPVVITEVVRDRIQAKLPFTGTLISLHTADLSAEGDGRVTLRLDTGTSVNKGDIIMRLDDTLLQQILAENQADAQSHRARIEFLKNEVARLGKLAQSSNAAISLLEETQSELGVSRSELAAAKARIAQTEERIRRMKLLAPFNGVIRNSHINVGEWISEGTAVADLVDADSLEIQAYISSDVLPYIGIGDTIDVEVDARPHKTTLHTIVPVGDDTSRLFELRLRLNGTFGQAGLPVRVFIPATSPRQSLLVHEDALVIRHNGVSVFRIGDDLTAAQLPVKVGLSANNGLIEVNGKLNVGDKVVIRGGERLRHGQKVQVVPPSSTTPPQQRPQ